MCCEPFVRTVPFSRSLRPRRNEASRWSLVSRTLVLPVLAIFYRNLTPNPHPGFKLFPPLPPLLNPPPNSLSIPSILFLPPPLNPQALSDWFRKVKSANDVKLSVALGSKSDGNGVWVHSSSPYPNYWIPFHSSESAHYTNDNLLGFVINVGWIQHHIQW